MGTTVAAAHMMLNLSRTCLQSPGRDLIGCHGEKILEK